MSAPSQPAARGPSPVEPIIRAVEGAAALDGPAATLGTVAREAFAAPPLKALLRGDWLGHAVHPVLSDVVVGTLLSASVLDVVGGDADGRARRRLIATAVAAAAPTALTGLNDWSEEEEADAGVRRAGVVHALSNSTALLLYAGSLTGGRGRGVALRLAGAAVLGAGAYLGGHLSFVKGVGVEPLLAHSRSVG